MKIERISLSRFELINTTPPFDLFEEVVGSRRRWTRRTVKAAKNAEIHLLHVYTDDGIEGISTVGDARYTTMRPEELEAIRILAVGENPLARERLYQKMMAATRGLFSRPGWFGAFDNCLWDIAGKAAGMPIYQLIGHAREAAPCYYNFSSASMERALEDVERARSLGFFALKDHFHGEAQQNIEALEAVRNQVGPEIPLFHDAAGCRYTLAEAISVGRALETLNYGWFEEPLPDRHQLELQQLCDTLTIPVMSGETLMHDVELSSLWLRSGATDLIRANARLGVTPILKLAHLAEMYNTTIELNGPGGLFGLVHAHLVCGLSNATYYEYFPSGTRDELGKEIGLVNPPLPHEGMIRPPDGPGWGAEWDWNQFEGRRVGEW